MVTRSPRRILEQDWFSTSCEVAPAGPADTTPSNQLIRQYFLYDTNLPRGAPSYLNLAVLPLNQRSRMTIALETRASGLRATVASTHSDSTFHTELRALMASLWGSIDFEGGGWGLS